jgi:ATP-dependent Clp protease ATP-binding subunit ClpC
MFERYTEKARRVIFFARFEASQFGSPYIDTEHLLLGLLREDKALAMRFLRAADEKIESIRKQIEQNTDIREKVSTSVDLPLSNESKRILAYAAEEAERLSHKHIGTEHLFLGMLREENCFAAALLRERGVRLSAVREELAMDRESKVGQEASTPRSWLAAYTSTLEDDPQRPLVGRASELMRLIQVLGRSTKKCAVLVGESGVGKRSIVTGLAGCLAEGDVPEFLAVKKLVVLDIARALAGTAAKQDVATKHLPREMTADPSVVFFMEELFELLVRPAASGSLDSAEILKPMFQSGKLQCISIATPTEYDEAVKNHRWLERCFSKIEVRPATEEETIEVLRRIKAHLEPFHSVVYEEGVIEHVVGFAHTYVKGLHLPGKAVDLMDEAGTYVKAHQPGLPQEIKELHKQIRFIVHRMEESVANHEFEKARFYSDEEHKARDDLRALEEKHRVKAGAVVTRTAVKEALALWIRVPVGSIKEPSPPKARKAPS